MKNRGKIEFMSAICPVTYRAVSSGYTPATMHSNADYATQPSGLSKTVKTLTKKIKNLGGRGDNSERPSHIQVC